MDTPLFTFGFATRDDKLARSCAAVLRQNHPHLIDRSEFVIIDNSETTSVDGVVQPNRFAIDLEKSVKGTPWFRYFRASGPSSSSLYRNRVFAEARGKYVVCFDPHVFFPPGSIDALVKYYEENPETSDLIMGPMISGVTGTVTGTNQRLYDNEPGETPKNAAVYNGVVCRGNQLGIWNIDPRGLDPASPPFEIQHQGMGAFSCRREAWPGWPASFRGFGGCETYMMEAFRKAGGKVLCLPAFRWDHSFYEPEDKPYKAYLVDRIRNYLVGFKTLGRQELYDAAIAHYTKQNRRDVETAIKQANEILNGKAMAAAPAKAAACKAPSDGPYRALLARSGLQESETISASLCERILKTPATTATLEFGSGVSTLAFDANGANHVCVERDAAKLDRLRPLLHNAATTVLIHDPDGSWSPKTGEMFSVILLHSAETTPPNVGTMLKPGGAVVIADTKAGPNKAMVVELKDRLALVPHRFDQNDREFFILKAPDAPLGEGPGTELKAIFEKAGFPACQQCIALARKMNSWGIDGCRDRMDDIVKDIMPRAKDWLKKEKPWAKALLGAAGLEEWKITREVRKNVEKAMAAAQEKASPVDTVVNAMVEGVKTP